MGHAPIKRQHRAGNRWGDTQSQSHFPQKGVGQGNFEPSPPALPHPHIQTRMGSFNDRQQGSYFPEWLLDARTRSERAFVQVVTEAYVAGHLH